MSSISLAFPLYEFSQTIHTTVSLIAVALNIINLAQIWDM